MPTFFNFGEKMVDLDAFLRRFWDTIPSNESTTNCTTAGNLLLCVCGQQAQMHFPLAQSRNMSQLTVRGRWRMRFGFWVRFAYGGRHKRDF